MTKFTARRVITTRHGGVSTGDFESLNLASHVGDDPQLVHKNRLILAQAVGVSLSSFRWMEQIHSRNVTIVDHSSPALSEATDALVTNQPLLPLVVLTADCVPVLLADEEKGILGAVHAGRQGARLGIVSKTIEVMKSLGAHESNITALLGPAIAGASYEVPLPMAHDVEKHLPGSITKTARGTVGLDLRAGISRQLILHKIGGLSVDPRDTAQDPSFFSYRRHPRTGRFASVIWCEEK